MGPPCSKSALLEGLEVDQYMWSVVQVRRGHMVSSHLSSCCHTVYYLELLTKLRENVTIFGKDPFLDLLLVKNA